MGNSYLSLSIAAIIPIFVAAVAYQLDHQYELNKKYHWPWQIALGIVFGAIAVLGTEWGIPMNGANVNCRDAAPLIAGLFFGGPAGIIAGVIGGVERWIAVAWGVGSFTRLACSVSTCIAGIYAALLRKFMFDNRRPGWVMALACGFVMEVFHLNMVFITNINEIAKALAVIEACTVPMVLANSLSVCIACVVLTILCPEVRRREIKLKKISQTIQSRMLICVVLAFFVTVSFLTMLQLSLAKANVESTLSNSIQDTENEVTTTTDDELLAVTRKVSVALASGQDIISVQTSLGVSEINIVDANGIITASTNPDYVGFDMASGEQSAEFLCLLKDQLTFVQNFQTSSSNVDMKYAGITYQKGFIQAGYNRDEYTAHVQDAVKNVALNRRCGGTGNIVVTYANGQVVSSTENVYDKVNVASQGIINAYKEAGDGVYFKTELFGNSYYAMGEETESGYLVFGLLPKAEAERSMMVALYSDIYVEVLIFAVLFAMIYFLIKLVIVVNLDKVNTALAEITNGNLDTVVDVHSNEEFASLSNDINQTVTALKHYIDEAAARIDKELEFARNIQASALPNTFPAFPKRKEFDIYACMYTAKEVGGDFYDFYITNSDTLNFLIADVSGKGIPAALFMMRAKTQLKSLTESDVPVNDVFTNGNRGLCEGNDAGMFVTAWQGALNLKTGLVQFANAGHTPPLVQHENGEFEYLRCKAGLVLAGMDGLKYKMQELQLQPGDTIYLYTDGVTEATNAENVLFGEDRLLAAVNSKKVDNVKDLCDLVKVHIDEFVADAPQFDDITMVALKYFGPVENTEEVQ